MKPALTAKEWVDGHDIGYGMNLYPDGPEAVTIEGLPNGASLSIRAEHLHALAAFCLHGQPFGFTREDVNALRSVLDLHRESWVNGVYGVDDICKHLADRIEALLPPEEESK